MAANVFGMGAGGFVGFAVLGPDLALAGFWDNPLGVILMPGIELDDFWRVWNGR